MDFKGVQVTWLGHGTYKITTETGKTLLIDAWVDTNPATPEDQKQLGKVDAILITHAHGDHTGDILPVVQRTQPSQIVAIFEMGVWLESKGVPSDKISGINKGGSVDVQGVRVSMVHADHSGALVDENGQIIYAGDPVGYVLEFSNGLVLYAAGDTNVFGDMQIIRDLYHPQVAVLPIGDYYTMSPRVAAYAARLIGAQAIIPIHYATFPLLTGTPEALRAELDKAGLNNVEVITLKPGETAR